MSETRTGRRQVQATASSAAQGAIQSEIESVILGRMEVAGGNLARLARFRSLMTEALGIIGHVNDIIDMAMAGFEAMTTPRRMLRRVAASHGFGYWAFQHTNISSPLNPPNSFLMMHRERDRRDRNIARAVNNPNFSSDGGLTSADWNIIWRRGVQSTITGMQNRMAQMATRGLLQPVLEQHLGPRVDIRRQSREAIVNQFRIVTMCPKLGSPSTAAGGFFLSSLKDATDLEKQMSLRLYRQFPYNPMA